MFLLLFSNYSEILHVASYVRIEVSLITTITLVTITVISIAIAMTVSQSDLASYYYCYYYPLLCVNFLEEDCSYTVCV